MPKIRTPEQEARRVAAQADFDAIKIYLNLFREAALSDSPKEELAELEGKVDAEFARLNDSQKNLARMVILQMTAQGKLTGLMGK